MAAVKPADADRFLSSGGRDAIVILIYGPDHGLVQERAATLLAKLVDDPADPFQLVRLEGDDLGADPQRLIDEALTIPLFGGRRAIRVIAGSRNIAAAVSPVFDAPLRECTIVIEAGDLKGNNPLRALVEKSPRGAAIACYEDDAQKLQRLIDEELTAHGIRLEGDGRAALVEVLGADRAASRMELRKLADYAAESKTVTAADIQQLTGDVARHEVDTLVDAAFSADLATLEREAGPQLRRVAGMQAVIGAALRHALLLQALSRTEDRSATESILAAGRIFFKRKPIVEQQRRMWPARKVDRAVTLLADAQLASRRQGHVGAAIVERALWSVALAARRG